MHSEKHLIRLALLDLYEGVENQGKRCLHQLITKWGNENDYEIVVDEFDVRLKSQVPDFRDYDVFISTGGPGSPLTSEGSEWEARYFEWLHSVMDWNSGFDNYPKKHVFFICHSFQLFCRHFQLGTVCKRKSPSFGVFPVHLMKDGFSEPVFEGLKNPFYVIDNREYQFIEPNHKKIAAMGGRPLALEKDRPHLHNPLERAIMAMRFNDYFIGTQFHPEAETESMQVYLQREDKRQSIIDQYGEAKLNSMTEHLNDPDKVTYTHSRILPNFLRLATESLVAQD